MPNWYENRLEVFINETDVDIKNTIVRHIIRFDKKTNEYALDFNLLIPKPNEVDIECSSIGISSYELLQSPQEILDSLLTDEFIAKHITEDNVKGLRLSLFSREGHWSLKDFIEWLKANPHEQYYWGYDFALGQVYINNLQKYGVTNWYDWSYKYWGVKWNALSQYCDYEEGHNSFYVDFDTPWNPPVQWFETLIETFTLYNVSFKLTYFEPGIFFAGVLSSEPTECCYYQNTDTEQMQILDIAKEFGYEESDWDFDTK